jgi:diguanylate cyclase
MDYETLKNEQQHRWHRKYANALWLIVALSLLFESLEFIRSQTKSIDDLLQYIVLPTVILTTIMGIYELIHARLYKGHDYLMVIVATSFSTMLLILHTRIDFIQSLLLFPIFTSLFYIKRALVIFAGVLNFILFLVITLSVEQLAARTSMVEVIIMLTIIAGATIIGMSVISRGKEVVTHLESVFETKQELLVQNIIMDKLMKTDALTDLYNHITFHEYLDKLMELTKNASFPLYLAILDIDNFKKVNDTYGHRSGDLVLKSVAGVIKETLTPNDFAARYGGEEFAILLTERSFEEAYELMERLRLKISLVRHPELDGQSVTVSIGLEQYRSGQNKEQLFHIADELLYRAKRSGKNRTEIVDRTD